MSKNQMRGLVIGIGLVLIVVISITAMKLTSKPGFCTNCHQIAPVVAAWEQSSHNQVDCLSCHADPGLAGYVERTVGGLKEVYLQTTGQYEVPVKAKHPVNTENCLGCHSLDSEGEEGKPALKDILPDHKVLAETGVYCIECHGNIGHKY